MGIEKVVLHIGIFKTGSSSIQDTLFYNSRRLKKMGILYLPEWGANQSPALFNMFSRNPYCHQYNLRTSLTTEDAVSKYNRTNTEILRAAVGADCKTLVVSGEDLCYLSPDELAALKEFFDAELGEPTLQVIAYVRNPLQLITSLYQQYCFIPQDFEKPERFWGTLFQKELGSIFQCFSKESIQVFSFEEALNFPGGLVGHFLEQVGLTEEQQKNILVKRSNESRCAEVCEFLEYIEVQKPLILNLDQGQKIVNPSRVVGDVYPLSAVKGAKFDLPLEKKLAFLESSRADIQWLKEMTGIDYSYVQARVDTDEPVYSAGTIHQLIQVYPLLTHSLKKLFLMFFKEKHTIVKDDKFKALFEKGSQPDMICSFSDSFSKKLHRNPEEFQCGGILFNGVTSVMEADYAQLFINYGEGFPWQDSQVFRQERDNSVYSILLELNPGDGVRYFRLDPSAYPCIAKMTHLLVNQRSDSFHLMGGNFDDYYEDVFAFFCDDPQIYYEAAEVITSIEIEYMLVGVPYPLALPLKKIRKDGLQIKEQNTMLRENIQEQASIIAEKDAILAFKDELIDQKEQVVQSRNVVINQNELALAQLTKEKSLVAAEKAQLSRDVEELTAMRQQMLDSRSWKITAPLRKIAKFFKN